MTEKQSQSFAERYKKQSPTFSGESMADRAKKSSQAAPTQRSTQTAAIDPQKKSKADLIYLVKGVDAGSSAWYYVLVERLKLQLFLKALNDDIIHLENYGVILYSAYGEEPPKDITEKLKSEYGISD